MKITITARHLKLTDAIGDYANKKIAQAQKFVDSQEENVRSHIILSVEKNRQIAEIILNIGGNSFIAKEQSGDIYSSIDLAMDKIDTQLRKYKEISKIHRNTNLRIAKEKKALAADVFSYDIMEDTSGKVSEVKRFALKTPVTINAAIEDMEALHYTVYMFLNADTNRINVLYRKESGASLVLLEPEF
ncbi:MAG: ribosome-associated translation inhibitor RaiA [Elusimicrobiota bacterium]|nr:ribosome-associated translation inhibitor RaiA [Elusimicrobiota bacterium]